MTHCDFFFPFFAFVIKVGCVGQFVGDMFYYVRVNHGGVIEMYSEYLFDICRYGGSLICDSAFLAYIFGNKS